MEDGFVVRSWGGRRCFHGLQKMVNCKKLGVTAIIREQPGLVHEDHFHDIMKYDETNKIQLAEELTQIRVRFELFKAQNLKLNMARGKPSKAQLDMVSDIFTILAKPEDFICDGIDVRNYGDLSEIPSAKRLFT